MRKLVHDSFQGGGALRRGLFGVASVFYDWMTTQETWRAQCQTLVDHFPPGEALRVLDVGVGPGMSAIGILDRLPRAQVVGVDISPKMIELARGRLREYGYPQAELLVADVARMPFEDASFDVVTGHSILYLLPDKAAAVAEIARVLRPGGRVVFVEPHEQGRHMDWVGLEGTKRFKLSMFLWREFSGHMGRFEAETLRALLASALEEVEVAPTLGRLGLLATATRR